MELPIGNFFEVTINSNKLFSFMQEIMKKIEGQETKVAEITKIVTSLSKGFQQRFAFHENSLAIEMQKLKKLNQQESNYIKLYVKDVDKKLSQKLVETQENISQLSKKLNSTKQAIQEDISIKLSYLEKKIQNMTVIEELQGRFNCEMGKMAEYIAKLEQSNRKCQENVDHHFRKNTEINQSIIERLKYNQGQKRSDNDPFLSIASSFREVDSKSRSKRKEKPSSTLYQQLEGMTDTLQMKMDDLQSKLQQKQPQKNESRQRRSILSNNKIVKYHQNASKKSTPRSNYTQKSQNIIKELQSNLMKKLSNIEELSVSKISQFQKELIKHNNKSQIIDEHIGILSRKLEKEKLRINEITDSVKYTNDKKVDEKMIESLKTMIKKISKDLEEALELKVNRENYDKDRQRIYEKIAPLTDAIIQKADKAEVKKGLSFLQEKLKEIIIVVAEERCSNQDGAIKKTPFKCLSCDKDLQSEKFEPTSGNNRLSKENSTANMRVNTTQMRKRIRLINNTVTTGNNDD